MPIVNIIKKASSLILGDDKSSEKIDMSIYEDNEVLFCKNNVCIHPPCIARQESDILHYPGKHLHNAIINNCMKLYRVRK